MMISNIAHIKDRLVENTTIVILFFLLAASLFFYITDKDMVAVLILALPAALLLVSSTRIAAYLFVVSIYFVMRLNQNSPLLLSDVMALMLMAAFAIDFLLKGRTVLSFPSIYKYYLYLFLALIAVSIFSYDYTYSITPLLRILVQFIIVVILFSAFDAKEIERLIKFFFWIPVGQSIYNMFYFFGSGGYDRMFGFAGAYYDDLCMLAWPVGLACFIWMKSRKSAYIYGVGTMLLLMGMLGTQSRAALFTPVWVSIILVVYSGYKARSLGQDFVMRRLKFLIVTVLFTGVVLMSFGYLAGTVARFQELPQLYSGTVWLRMSLWSASLNAFWDNPLTGIGPGAFRYIETINPLLRFDAARLYLDEASAHNLFLHYLAETGLIGTIALLALFLKNLLTSIKLARFSKYNDRSPISIGLFGAGLAIFGSIFYMDGWMWGQNAHAVPLFFAVTAKLVCDKYSPNKQVGK
jgi:hypothetical protein